MENPTLMQNDDVPRDIHDVFDDVAAEEDHTGQSTNQVDHDAALLRIQTSTRLVEQEHIGIGDERLGKRETAHHSS